VGLALWWRGAHRAAGVVAAFGRAASEMGLIRVDERRGPMAAHTGEARDGRHD
jgi:hypothetical protein